MAAKIIDMVLLEEDRRIKLIGETAMNGGTVGVLLEKYEPEKIARYIRKVAERFPDVVVLSRKDGPTKKVVTIKFCRRTH